MGKVKQRCSIELRKNSYAQQADVKAPDPSFLTSEEEEEAAQDFGGLVHSPPCWVVSPLSAESISSLVKAANSSSKLTITARGNGHSIHGQSQAMNNGIGIHMTNMPINIHVAVPSSSHQFGDDSISSNNINNNINNSSSNSNSIPYVDASAGALWIDVLTETLKHGLAPRSWTDYLHLTVGGTLSNAGVSGQAFRHGPQISNVLQLEVVTGKGDIVTCSAKRNSELFFAVLGGLGQFGIVTKARIPLEEAPQRARYLRLLYADFEAFRKDMEYLISRPGDNLVNYVEGIVVPNTDDPHQGWNSVPFHEQKIDPKLVPESSGPVLYCIEIAKYYNQHESLFIEDHLASLLASLSHISRLEFSIDLTYFEFLDRVTRVEEALRKIHRWNVPHPWLILFVPRSKISKFNDLVFKEIVHRGVNGPMLVYPLNRSKWETRSSVVIPEENVFYMVGLLRYVVDEPLEVHLEQNAEILRKCESNGLGVKQYFPHYRTDTDWKQHFGDSWRRFSSNKLKFDPNAVLCPGQRIFSRNKVTNNW